jgi:hypothetical protein
VPGVPSPDVGPLERDAYAHGVAGPLGDHVFSLWSRVDPTMKRPPTREGAGGARLRGATDQRRATSRTALLRSPAGETAAAKHEHTISVWRRNRCTPEIPGVQATARKTNQSAPSIRIEVHDVVVFLCEEVDGDRARQIIQSPQRCGASGSRGQRRPRCLDRGSGVVAFWPQDSPGWVSFRVDGTEPANACTDEQL